VVGPGSPALARTMQAAWAAFAREADPSCEPLGRWSAYDTGRRTTMLLGERSQPQDDPNGARRQRWAELAPMRMA
jgi:carboxylesterase type B